MAAVVMATVASFVVVTRGEVLCLCDVDPDGCGEPCHECKESEPSSADGLSETDACVHLDLPATDLTLTNDDVLPPVVDRAPPAVVSVVEIVPCGSAPVPCQTSSPSGRLPFCRLSTRLMPRS